MIVIDGDRRPSEAGVLPEQVQAGRLLACCAKAAQRLCLQMQTFDAEVGALLMMETKALSENSFLSSPKLVKSLQKTDPIRQQIEAVARLLTLIAQQNSLEQTLCIQQVLNCGTERSFLLWMLDPTSTPSER